MARQQTVTVLSCDRKRRLARQERNFNGYGDGEDDTCGQFNTKAKRIRTAGGDLRSPDGAALSVEAVEAFADLAREAGYEILKPMKKKADFIRPDPSAH